MVVTVDFGADVTYFRGYSQMRDRYQMPSFRQIEFLYSDLERCRSVFVDGILETLLRNRQISLVRNESDVDQHTEGMSRVSWRLLRRVYRNRLEPDMLTRVSRRVWLRRGWSPRGRLLRLLRRDLRNVYLGHDRPLVVDHAVLPLLIRAGGGIVYNHGEMGFGRENAATAADVVLVPTSGVADRYIAAGVDKERIIVTGLCIEPALIAQAMTAFEQRLTRIEDGGVITGGIFVDETEPSHQVREVTESVVSVCRQGGGRLFVFCQSSGYLSRRLAAELTRQGLPWGYVDSAQGIGAELHPVTLVQTENRRQERGLVARLFADLDYVVAPPREKLLWAVGLGLPLIWLRKGFTEAELDSEQLGNSLGVARSIHVGRGKTMLGPLVNMLQDSGELAKMARVGWGKYPLDGFEAVAKILVNLCQ